MGEGVDQFEQAGVGLDGAVLVGGVDDAGVEAVLHRLGDVGPADADLPPGQVAHRVAHAQREMRALEFRVALDLPDGLERAVGVARHARLHRHVDRQRKDGRVEEDLLGLESVPAHRLVEDPMRQGAQLVDRVRPAGTGRLVLADQQRDDGEIVLPLERQDAVHRVDLDRVDQRGFDGRMMIHPCRVPFLQARFEHVVVAAVDADRYAAAPAAHQPGVLNHHPDRQLRIVLAEGVEIDRNVVGVVGGLRLDQRLDVVEFRTGLGIGVGPEVLQPAHDLAGLGNRGVDGFADRDQCVLHRVVPAEQIVEDRGGVLQCGIAARVDRRP